MSVAPVAATEKSASAWRNATARLGRLVPELGSWLEDLELLGERDERLLLIDRGKAPSPCPRCEALLSQSLLPLGYTGAKLLPAPEPSKTRQR